LAAVRVRKVPACTVIRRGKEQQFFWAVDALCPVGNLCIELLAGPKRLPVSVSRQ
jgi:hypothetical protein